jgi:asparagine synthase (glutamine-hydrolysing)
MCGICGIKSFSNEINRSESRVRDAVQTLRFRGPDASGIFTKNNIVLGHARLSVIDTSDAATQPLSDVSERYTIVFNGEFYNYREHRNNLLNKGLKLKSSSDTEVLLYMFIEEGPSFINKVNGCFAIAIYDNVQEELFLFRDRFGVKPLLYFIDKEGLLFASEMKALMAMNVPRVIDHNSLHMYLQLNYIPSPWSIFENVKKLNPGNYLKITKSNEVEIVQFYELKQTTTKIDYKNACDTLYGLLDKAVERRLISDVPLGAFLSGGIDSSVVVALASKYVNSLNTYSIGYKNNPFFDETKYAEIVAKKFNTNHTVFSLTNNDLLEHVDSVLDYIDEPFADSSAIPLYILSRLTKKQVTVALSGDGADEVFAGYHKHMAHFKAAQNNTFHFLVKNSGALLNIIPKSRNNKLLNKFRQLARFSEGLNLSPEQRYWRWCSFLKSDEAQNYLNKEINSQLFEQRKHELLKSIKDNNINDVLFTDVNLVLQSDMLCKVDLMSMANSLEVRSPFMDYTVIDFAFSLQSEFKINRQIKKRIVQDTFRSILPSELYNRPKKGFEVPMLDWLRTDLSGKINDLILNKEFIESQNLFLFRPLKALIEKLYSNNPGDSHATVWAFLVFQHWWKKYMS